MKTKKRKLKNRIDIDEKEELNSDDLFKAKEEVLELNNWNKVSEIMIRILQRTMINSQR